MTYILGADVFDSWRQRVLSGKRDPCWPSKDPIFDHVKTGAGRIVLLAGPPGAGKTALLNQWVMSLLEGTPTLKVLLANVEMSPERLLNRQLSRVSEVPLSVINKGSASADQRILLGLAFSEIEQVMDRLAFASCPHEFGVIAKEAEEFKADVIILDYVQRIEPRSISGMSKPSGLREKTNVLMGQWRKVVSGFGACICGAVAVARSRDNKGRSSYDGKHLSMASLRESGELEYGADDCLLLFPTNDDMYSPVRDMTLKHEKSRYDEMKDVALQFDRRIQRFQIDPFVVPMVGSVQMKQATNSRANGKTF
jgi:replicative DNA helicase